ESVITYTLSRVEGEDVGTYTITPAGAAEQGNYNVVYATGELSILARTVVLTSATDSKVYDGTPLTNDNVTVSGDGFVEGEVTDIKATGSALLPGDVKDNPISYTTTDKFNAQNYQITEEIGKLTITSRNDEDEDPDNDTYKIEFNVNDGTFTYDGKEHNVEGYVEENEDGTLTWKNDKGIEFTITGIAASETKTDAGEYTVESTGDPIVKDADGNDVTSQFTVTVNDGTLTINKKAVTLTSADDSKYYDGTPLTNDTVTAEGFVEGEGATYDVTGTITYVGTAKNEFTYELNENTKAGNYEITTVFGTLEIKSRNDEDEDPDNDTYKVEFNVNKGTFTYDGKEHTVEGYIEENEDGTLTWTNDKGVKFTISGISASETKTDAGKYAVTSTGKAVVKDPAGVDVTDQFTVTVNDGELLINPKEITVKIDGNKEDVLYDGKEHTVEGYTVECDDELFNEENVKFTGDDKVSGTEPGTYPMGLEEDQFSYDDPNFVVKFEVTDGELQLSTLEKYSYKVEHYLQNLEDDKFTLKDTENLEASFNQTVKATAKEYEGFTLDKTVEGTVESAVVKIDGEVVLRLYYTRDTFDLTFKLNGGIFNGSTEDIIETYKYGEVIKIHEAPTREGYEFTHWEGSKYYPGDEYTVTEDHTFTAQWNRVDVPQTGDANNAKLWLALFGVSLSNSLALAYVSLKKKKEEE
ncbi:MAG: InlB B-repeat-containing protein, partial [Erysipelotrichaceae bacterium]|nr:InlB B-repeat-containing protein [Erysipelotrichaceae bacterium]